MRYLMIIVCVSFASHLAIANTIHVPSDSATIQAGINGAVNGDTVLVAAGTYSGPGNEAIRFYGKRIILKSEAGPEQTILLTLDTVRTIIFDNGEDSNSVLDGFTISGGYEDNFDIGYEFRGGLLSDDTSPTIRTCIISGCYAKEGGGAHFSGGTPKLVSCRIFNNHSTDFGGGIFFNSIEVLMTDTKIMNNIVHNNGFSDGGGIFSLGGLLILRGCRIAKNRAGSLPYLGQYSPTIGGGIFVLLGGLIMDSCVISQNSAGNGGGIFAIPDVNDYSITSSLIYNNTATSNAGIAILIGNAPSIPSLKVANCTFACNYGAEINCDGIAFLKGWPSGMVYKDSFSVERSSLALQPPDIINECEITSNIFAFNASTPVLWENEYTEPCISHNNVWSTVSGPDYGGVLSSQTGQNGNISNDPLFCAVSDSGFRLDVSSPCVGTGENGSNMGTFDIGCDMYDGGSPKNVVAPLIADGLNSASINQPIIDSAMNLTNPWDTLSIVSDLYDVYIDQMLVDKPLYIQGQGMAGPDAFNLSSSEWWPSHSAPAVYLQSFCVFQNMYMSQNNIFHTSYLFAIGTQSCSPIIRDSHLWSHQMGFPSPQHIYDNASPLYRNCNLSSGLDLLGALDCVASHNYWGYSHCRMDDYKIIDGVEYPGRGYVLWQPCLTKIPTDVHEELPNIPAKFELAQNYPNPFNSRTVISFAVEKRSNVSISVYNQLGQLVKVLYSGTKSAGSYQVIWDGTNGDGTLVSSGVYVYTLKGNTDKISRKMVFLK